VNIQCVELRSINHHTLKAIAKINVKEWGISISDVKLFLGKDDKYWSQLPTKQYESEGQKKYFRLINFDDKEKEKIFLGEVCDVLLHNIKTAKESYKDCAQESRSDKSYEGHNPFFG
jgi:hypothetical protein